MHFHKRTLKHDSTFLRYTCHMLYSILQMQTYPDMTAMLYIHPFITFTDRSCAVTCHRVEWDQDAVLARLWVHMGLIYLTCSRNLQRSLYAPYTEIHLLFSWFVTTVCILMFISMIFDDLLSYNKSSRVIIKTLTKNKLKALYVLKTCKKNVQTSEG